MTTEERRQKNRERHQRYREKNREKVRRRSAENMKKYYNANPEKFRCRKKKWYNKNREDVLQKQREKDKTMSNYYQRMYRKKHPFRILCTLTNRYYSEKIHPMDLWSMAKKQKMRCALTGDLLTRENISVDHIIPRFKGGRNILSNIRLTIRDANFMKNIHSDEQLLTLCQKIVKFAERIK